MPTIANQPGILSFMDKLPSSLTKGPWSPFSYIFLTCFGYYLVINFTGNGFAGFYVGGSHSYTITYRSSTEMYLKTIGFDNNAWYVKLTNQ